MWKTSIFPHLMQNESLRHFTRSGCVMKWWNRCFSS